MRSSLRDLGVVPLDWISLSTSNPCKLQSPPRVPSRPSVTTRVSELFLDVFAEGSPMTESASVSPDRELSPQVTTANAAEVAATH